MEFITVILFGLSVCADCFAVSLCSSVNISKPKASYTLSLALIFAIVQTGFLVIGWAFANAIVGAILSIAKWLSLALLAYVGGDMLYSALFKKGCECHNLNGLKNILLGAVATSLDALAIGTSLGFAGQNFTQTLPQIISVFVCTALSVAIGIVFGHKIGQIAGRWAEAIGGAILIATGISIVL